jgi:hypothetical protein
MPTRRPPSTSSASAAVAGTPDRPQCGRGRSVVVGKILDQEQYNFNFGFDAQTGEYSNLMSKGVIDPTKVVRAALQVAGPLITIEAISGRGAEDASGSARHALRWHRLPIQEAVRSPIGLIISTTRNADAPVKNPAADNGRRWLAARVSVEVRSANRSV